MRHLVLMTKWIKDTKLARRLYEGSITDYKDGKLLVEYWGEEPVILGAESGFTYGRPDGKMFKL